MKIQKIKIKKSRTFGITVNQKTKYAKVEIELGGEYEPGDDVTEGHKQLSTQVEAMLIKEKEIIVKSLN